MNKVNKAEDCKDSLTIIAQRVLSATDDDMTILNTAILTNVDSTTGDPNSGDNNWNQSEKSQKELKVVETTYDKEVQEGTGIKNKNIISTATATITPPTGADKISPVVYIATGAIALVILSAGIVIIKKKILN